jgi:inorganic pyrophosphatase
MEIIDYFTSDQKEYWLAEIKKSDWGAGQYLHELLRDGKMKELCGESTKVLLLIEGTSLLAFCTYAEQDDVREPSLTPWAGFVYTFPQYRGKRRVGKLLEYVYMLAKRDGLKHIYISTGETGLYEKYGYRFWKMMKAVGGEESRVYITDIVTMDYSNVIGSTVKGTIDRPLGSSHPRHPEMVYPINYGYVDGIFAGDGAEQDVYVFGTDRPIGSFSGTVVGVYHRLNDNEDKWIVSLNGEKVDKEEILSSIRFQEQYFMGELYL